MFGGHLKKNPQTSPAVKWCEILAYKPCRGGIEAACSGKRADWRDSRESMRTREFSFPISLTNFCDRGAKCEAHAASKNPTPSIITHKVRTCSNVQLNYLNCAHTTDAGPPRRRGVLNVVAMEEHIPMILLIDENFECSNAFVFHGHELKPTVMMLVQGYTSRRIQTYPECK